MKYLLQAFLAELHECLSFTLIVLLFIAAMFGIAEIAKEGNNILD